MAWVNYFRMGSYMSTVYVACLFTMLQFPPDAIKAAKKAGGVTAIPYANYVDGLEIALIGILPAFLLGVMVSYLRLRFYRITVVNRFK